MNTPSAHDQAEQIVKVAAKIPGGPIFIELGRGDENHVSLGPYENPAVAREEAERIRAFLVGLIEQTPPAKHARAS